MCLAGKNAVITGGTSGIGLAITEKLLSKGVSVCLISRKPADTCRDLLENLHKTASVSCYQGDLSNEKDLLSFCKYAQKQMPTVDILIHCAGAYHMGTLEETPVAELDRLYRINLRAPYVLTQLLLPKLKHSKGQIVVMNSSVVKNDAANHSHYKSSKAALRALTDCLRQEVNCDGVRVLSVFPGRTASPMQKMIHQIEQRPYELQYLIQPADIAKIVINALELPATAEITDIHVRPSRKYNQAP